MMASELVRMILDQITLHGDCEIRIDGDEVIYPVSSISYNAEDNSVTIE